MTAATITEMSRDPITSDVLSGTAKRRSRIFVRTTTDVGGNATINLQTYDPTIADVEGVEYVTDDGAALDVAADITWSTYTVTVVPASSEMEFALVVTHT